uniref:Mothers against decapentaplegic homolog n=1 Tax=Bursaphelenchus xylophilus TaxID=6326 RepID=A0A1I7SQS2_BURXY
MPRWLMTTQPSSSPLTGCLSPVMDPFLATRPPTHPATFAYDQHQMQSGPSGMNLKIDRNSLATPSSSNPNQDPCAQVVQVLLCYHQGGEDPDFIKKAIESLVKKLKDKQRELDALISAVTSSGKQATSCVTINRSLDGRLQVAGRKGVPHVVYTRIWRWPNVSKNELQKLPVCTTPSDHPDLICINPFHYDRIVSSSIGNIDMNSLRMDGVGQCNSNQDVDMCVQNSPEMAEQKDSIKPFLMYGPHQQPSYVVSHLPTGDTISTTTIPSFMQLSPTENKEIHWKSRDYGNQDFPSGSKENGNNFGNQRYNSLRCNLSRVRIPNTSPVSHWCSISYYELDTQIGQTFKVPRDQAEVTIDGGMDPAGARLGRFCLGALSNVHRSEASEKARIHIGRGIKIKQTQDGNVYLTCLSQKGAFVRSYFLDFEHGLVYGSTVHKFSIGAEKKVNFRRVCSLFGSIMARNLSQLDDWRKKLFFFHVEVRIIEGADFEMALIF